MPSCFIRPELLSVKITLLSSAFRIYTPSSFTRPERLSVKIPRLSLALLIYTQSCFTCPERLSVKIPRLPLRWFIRKVALVYSSCASPSWKTSFSQRYGQNVYPSFESGRGTADLFLVRCCLIWWSWKLCCPLIFYLMSTCWDIILWYGLAS